MHRSKGLTECLRTGHDSPVGSKQTGVGTGRSFPTNSAPPISAQAVTKWARHTFELIGTVLPCRNRSGGGTIKDKIRCQSKELSRKRQKPRNMGSDVAQFLERQHPTGAYSHSEDLQLRMEDGNDPDRFFVQLQQLAY